MAAIARFSRRVRACQALSDMTSLGMLGIVEVEQIMADMYRVTCSPQHLRDFLRSRGYVSTDVEVWSTTAV